MREWPAQSLNRELDGSFRPRADVGNAGNVPLLVGLATRLTDSRGVRAIHRSRQLISAELSEAVKENHHMAPQRPMPRLDAAKLRENALTSIRLGVEDFERCRHPGGDPARALSAIRNLFAGVLLLFKYKIATCVDDPADAAALIFNPPEVLPHSDGDGGVEWGPVGKFKPTTIDVGTIQKRFEAFEIDVDWAVIEKLQACRNHLEHLHPAHTLGEVADFVAELFPVLRDFIQTELEESPAAILGDAWQLMLLHHNFFREGLK